MKFDTKKDKDLTVVSIAGRMDAVTTPEAEDRLAGLIDAGERSFVVDLQQLDYISSAGLRGILATAKKLKAERGDIVFANLQGHVNEVFKISGFQSLFKIFDSVDAAVNELRRTE
ncbi:MAG: putative anti-sigma factor antagonist BtrV [Syntrophorhabdus sp. PtaU1.Bin153]|nr:MAG: putative anti-sigma factor antagonist BtrV [Syntrophorhabdus sp. PtaU1.Bin153]